MAHVTLDLSKYDALTAYKGLPDEKPFRTTFLINEEGIVERIITPKEVKTKEHASQILNQ